MDFEFIHRLQGSRHRVRGCMDDRIVPRIVQWDEEALAGRQPVSFMEDLDALAQDGLVVEQCRSSAPWGSARTRPSLTVGRSAGRCTVRTDPARCTYRWSRARRSGRPPASTQFGR